MGKCAAPACPKQVKPDFLMCWEHWNQVPRQIQRAVNRTWRHYQIAMDESTNRAYQETRRQAIAAVESQPKGNR